MDESRPLPRSVDAERAVLGGLMLQPGAVAEIAEALSVEDFFREGHQKLFQLMVDMSERGEPTEMLAVAQEIARGGMQEEMGGLAYVSSLPDNVPSTENLSYYAGVVRARAVERRLVESTREIAGEVLAGQKQLTELLDFAESRIFEVTQEKGAADWAQLSMVLDEEVLRIQALADRDDEVTGTTTGFTDLDKILAGLHPTDLVILAARPAMGKTALALNLARNAAMSGGIGVGIFSLEMGKGQLVTRMLCSQSRVNADKVRRGYLSRERDWPALTQGAEDLFNVPVFIDDSAALTVTQIRSKSRRLKRKHPELGLIVVDYIGLMGGDSRISREQQVAASSRGLKALAKELDVCVLVLSQLNRGVEARPNKRPQLSDLRESGAIEQDADVIMFIYRDEYYNEETTTEPGVAEVIVAKQRNGPTGTVKLAFQGEFLLFSNLARRDDLAGYLE